MRCRILVVIECSDVSAIRGLQKECWVKRAYSTCLAANSLPIVSPVPRPMYLSLHDLFLLAVLAYPHLFLQRYVRLAL